MEGEDILTFVTIIRDFLNNISAKDITSVESWEASGRLCNPSPNLPFQLLTLSPLSLRRRTANMSPNLMALFGKPAVSSTNPTIEPGSPNWSAPSKFGLNNSSPIFVTVSAKAATNSSSRSVDSPKAMHRQMGGAKDEDGDADVAEPKNSPLLSAPTKDTKDDKGEEKDVEAKEQEGPPTEEGEGEEDDDDYDDDDDEEEEEEEEPRQITMSLNLMRALGLDTTGSPPPRFFSFFPTFSPYLPLFPLRHGSGNRLETT